MKLVMMSQPPHAKITHSVRSVAFVPKAKFYHQQVGAVTFNSYLRNLTTVKTITLMNHLHQSSIFICAGPMWV